MGMDSTTKMGLLLGLAGVVAREDHVDPIVDAALPVLLTIGDVTSCRIVRETAEGPVVATAVGQELAPIDLADLVARPSPVDRSTAPCRRLGKAGDHPGHQSTSPRPRGRPRPGQGRRLGLAGRGGHARAGADDPRRRTRPSPVAGGPARSHRAGEQRPAAGEHGGLRLAHPDGHQHLVRPAVPDLRARAAVLPPQLREVPLADPPRRPGAHLRAPPARLRHG